MRRDYKSYTEETVEYIVTCSNNFFDTTSGHILNISNRSVTAPNKIEYKISFKLVNHPNQKVKNGTYTEHDKYLGDGNYETLSDLITKQHSRIAVCFTTITNNSGGSQPVSLDHIEKVSELCRKFNIPYMMDSCRFAENAFMIKKIEGSSKSV